MHSSYFALTLLLMFVPPKLSPQQSKQSPEQFWSWFSNCSNKKYMGFELWMSGEIIHKTSFPICPIKDLSEEDPRHKILRFFFNGGHVFQGKYPTKPTQKIEENIWQAETDGGDILLGVSFSVPGRHGQILLNTIHVASAYKESRTQIDKRLIVHTFLIQRQEQSQ